MQRLIGLIGIVLCVALSNFAMAAAVTTFTVVSPVDKETTGIGRSIRVEFDGDQPLACRDITLLLNNQPGLSTDCTMAGRQAFLVLSRTEANRSAWAGLIGGLGPQLKQYPIAMSVGNTMLKPAGTASETVSFERFQTRGWVIGAILAGAVVLIILGVVGRTSSMFRDTGIPQMAVTERSFSLGRCQMALWFFLTLSAFLFIFAITGDTDSLNSESFLLMGISATTALGSIAIDQSKNEAEGIRQAIIKIGLATRAQVIAAQEAEAHNGEGAKELMEKYRTITAPLRTGGFLVDLVTDINGATIYRWQIVVWTMVLAVIYFYKTVQNLETPVFGNSLLTLMGISSGVYLGFKIPESQVAPKDSVPTQTAEQPA